MKFPCTCPYGWPRLIHHEEGRWPVTIVRHDVCCSLDSVRVSGVHLPATVFENRVSGAVGEKRAAMEERRRG